MNSDFLSYIGDDGAADGGEDVPRGVGALYGRGGYAVGGKAGGVDGVDGMGWDGLAGQGQGESTARETVEGGKEGAWWATLLGSMICVEYLGTE